MPSACSYIRNINDIRLTAEALLKLGVTMITILHRNGQWVRVQDLPDDSLLLPINKGLQERSLLAAKHHQKNIEKLEKRGYQVTQVNHIHKITLVSRYTHQSLSHAQVGKDKTIKQLVEAASDQELALYYRKIFNKDWIFGELLYNNQVHFLGRTPFRSGHSNMNEKLEEFGVGRIKCSSKVYVKISDVRNKFIPGYFKKFPHKSHVCIGKENEGCRHSMKHDQK